MQGYANNVTLGGTTYAGICYSSTNTTPTTSDLTLTKSSVGSDNSYSVVATKLTPATTYYYRAYVYRGGLVQYAASTYSFTTPSAIGIVTTGAATDITSVAATISSSFTLPSSAYSSITRGVCYSATNASPTTSDTKVITTSSSNGSYSVSLTGLTNNTLYYYCSYIIVDGRTVYGETRSFTTEKVGTASNVAVTGNISGTVEKSQTEVTCTANIGSIEFSTIVLGVCWSAAHTDPTLNDNTVTTQQMDADSKYVVCLTGFNENTTYYYRAYIKTDKDIYYGDVKTFKTAKTFPHEYVEIGGVKWSTKNLGASTIAGDPATCYGDYYAWGETEPRYTSIAISDASSATFGGWKTYHSYGYSSSDYPSYTGTTLDAEHDAATQNWGTSWRTPTKADFEALLKACTGSTSDCTSTTVSANKKITTGGVYWLSGTNLTIDGTTYGVKGILYVDKTDTSKRVFFPAAGNCYDTNSYSGSYGLYWSSSLYMSDTRNASYLYFNSSRVNTSLDGGRYGGFTVRPVSK